MRVLFRNAFLILITWGSVIPADLDRLMVQGNDHYAQANFEAAITAYEKILSSGMTSTTVHYNLGCAYFSLKEYGEAILHFELARQLSPRDVDVLHNLEYAKLFLKDRFELPEPMPIIAWVKTLRHSLSLAELKLTEQVLFILLVLSIILYRLVVDHRLQRVIGLSTVVLALLFVIMTGWLVDRVNTREAKRGVLLVEDANITSAPIPGASTLFIIHEGTSGEILDATDGWYELRLDDGKTGWVTHEAVGLY